METAFRKLNAGWNADPNAPEPRVTLSGSDLTLSFRPNPFQFPEYEGVETIHLKFLRCSRYRLGSTNDEGWYRGQCRFSGLAPPWGEFYEVTGDLLLDKAPRDWLVTGEAHDNDHHFLFYFRDETFECDAQQWQMEPGA